MSWKFLEYCIYVLVKKYENWFCESYVGKHVLVCEKRTVEKSANCYVFGQYNFQKSLINILKPLLKTQI